MEYAGGELELFAEARNWKRYWSSVLRPFVRGRVLDVGCGIGANADFLWNEGVARYTFLEPDGRLLAQVPEHAWASDAQSAERVQGTTSDLRGKQFDTILYIDVIEHIEDSRAELQRAHGLLAPGGHLLILVPAFQFLYSEFDKAIGHHRRYDKRLLKQELPPGMELLTLCYLDSMGLLLSLGNKWFLKQGEPSVRQIHFWDRSVVPVSRVTDKIFLHSFGRSLLAIAHKAQ